MRGEANVKFDAVVISTAAATEEGLRGLDDTTIYRIKEGDESAVPGPLRDFSFQLVKILAGKRYSDIQSEKARHDKLLIALFSAVVSAVLAVFVTLIAKS
jgi:hypothetical protein